MTKRARVLVIVISGLLLVAFVGFVPLFIRARSTSAVIPCVNNLVHIDRAENQWALEHHKTRRRGMTYGHICHRTASRFVQTVGLTL